MANTLNPLADYSGYTIGQGPDWQHRFAASQGGGEEAAMLGGPFSPEALYGKARVSLGQLQSQFPNVADVRVDPQTMMAVGVDAQGAPVQGATFSMDDTGDFMRDAALVIGGGYFGGGALANAVGGAAGGGGLGGTAVGASEFGVPLASGGAPAVAGAAPAVAGAAPSAAGPSAGGWGGFTTGDWARLAQTGVGLIAQDQATKAASQGQADANALIGRMYDQNRADNQPLMDLRNEQLPRINALMADPSSVTSLPGYQFQLKQGQDQIDNQLAAQGGYYSGRQLKASQKYGQDYAGSRIDQHLNRLMGVAGLGQIGANANQTNSTNYGLTGSNGLAQQGNIRAGGYVGQGNIIGGGIGGWINNWQDEQARRAVGGP